MNGVLDIEVCPVCWRPVAVSNIRRLVFSHHDKAMNVCPMGGHPMGGEDFTALGRIA